MIEWDAYRLSWARFKCSFLDHQPVTLLLNGWLVRCCARCGREL